MGTYNKLVQMSMNLKKQQLFAQFSVMSAAISQALAGDKKSAAVMETALLGENPQAAKKRELEESKEQDGNWDRLIGRLGSSF